MQQQTRRELLGSTGLAALGAGMLASIPAESDAAGSLQADPAKAGSRRVDGRISFGLNTSTIRGHNLTIVQEVDLAARAGYEGLEPWVGELERYRDGGGSLDDLRKRIRDSNLSVESAIGFFDWVVDDDSRRKQAIEVAKRNMELVRSIGGVRIAAPPAGATRQEGMDLRRIAERYRTLLEAGLKIGVVPQVEIWGPSKTLGKLSEAVFVAIEAGHPRACILPDVYHLYRGGSEFSGISLLGPSSIHVFHLNDYPARPPRQELKDADRVFPGDGVAPLASLVRDLRSGDFDVMFSLELFNEAYWKREPWSVLEEGLRKMRSLVVS